MDRKNLLIQLVCLMLVMYVMDSLALRFYWYYTVWWFDIPMHFFGGLWEGLLFVWFFSIEGLPFPKFISDFSGSKLIYKTILFVLFIGISWELFEFYANNYIDTYPFDILDTLSDICFDLAGGLCAILYLWKKQQK